MRDHMELLAERLEEALGVRAHAQRSILVFYLFSLFVDLPIDLRTAHLCFVAGPVLDRAGQNMGRASDNHDYD